MTVCQRCSGRGWIFAHLDDPDISERNRKPCPKCGVRPTREKLNYSPEPWDIYEAYGRRDNVASELGHVATFEIPDDAERAKICVNACAGVPAKQLRPGIVFALLQSKDVKQ